MADIETVTHEEHGALAHHFDNMEQQREAGTLGMWVFLVTEIMFFGGMFLAYTLYRSTYPEEFSIASNSLDVTLGGINTAVLICSSLTMVMAVYGAQTGNRRMLMGFLMATMFFGLVFLGIKAVEYKDKFDHHHFPGRTFVFAEHGEEPVAAPESAGSAHTVEAQSLKESGKIQMFFWIYFAMTGLHALHMIIGLGVMSVLLYMAKKGRFTPEYHSPVELSGLYWHFVDIVWIFLFPLLYLLGRHNLH